MNYKIRITEENQAIVKRIADENGMNPSYFEFHLTESFYIIKENKFYVGNVGYNQSIFLNYTEITTEQFVQIFDKKETLVGRWFQALEDNASYSQVIKNNFYQICRESDREIHFKVPHHGNGTTAFGLDKEYENKSFKLMPKDFQPTQETEIDKWLKETKAKNLSLEELEDIVSSQDTCPPSVWRKLDGRDEDKAQILFNQWNEPTEWQPKRGDRVLVWDDDEKLTEERIFLAEIKGSILPIVTVTFDYENDFKKENEFETTEWKNMKPLQDEQPKETDFKTKVIELVEKRIEESIEKMKASSNDNSFQDALAWKIANQECGQLLNQIKQL
jgi:hypothetical protein